MDTLHNYYFLTLGCAVCTFQHDIPQVLHSQPVICLWQQLLVVRSKSTAGSLSITDKPLVCSSADKQTCRQAAQVLVLTLYDIKLHTKRCCALHHSFNIQYLYSIHCKVNRTTSLGLSRRMVGMIFFKFFLIQLLLYFKAVWLIEF